MINMQDKERMLVYKSISYLLTYPRELNAKDVDDYKDALMDLHQHDDGEIIDLTLSFIDDLKSIHPEYYVDLFELSPKCPLYISHYAHEDDMRKRRFMVEVSQTYKSLGFNLLGGELPDFLPIVTEFLGLSLSRKGKDRRIEFISKYVSPWVHEMSIRLEKIESPYHKLLRALDTMVKDELKMSRTV